jgi:CheY-like chemotaxis protein
LQQCRVLVVDDLEDAATTLSALVEAMGHTVRYVLDPKQALMVANHLQPDVAFIDLLMPGLNGFELAKLLRREFGERIKLVAFSGSGDPKARAQTGKAGFDAHIVKPADLALIQATIAQLCPPHE